MMLSGLIVPLRALIIAAAGAGLAWGWYGGHRWLVVTPLIAAAVGLVISETGVRRLPSDPVMAVRLMPWRILVPAAIAVAAAALVIIATVELTLPDKTAAGTPTPNDLKEVVSAVTTAVTGFLSAAFIDWAGDDNDSRLADWIRGVFSEKYLNLFEPGSTAANLVYSSLVVDGWGPVGRMTRARGIATEIKGRALERS